MQAAACALCVLRQEKKKGMQRRVWLGGEATVSWRWEEEAMARISMAKVCLGSGFGVSCEGCKVGM
jgi:hypothetical protein